MSATDAEALKGYARQAAEGETELERQLAASILLHAALKALEERSRLTVVPKPDDDRSSE